jgi:hypothetical protein
MKLVVIIQAQTRRVAPTDLNPFVDVAYYKHGAPMELWISALWTRGNFRVSGAFPPGRMPGSTAGADACRYGFPFVELSCGVLASRIAATIDATS